ncbi:type II secretion system protein GspL [Piscinibacter sp.]|uniref:type II secretion system protein GspL n=1 Tax=Piscinibacter sp. TaxID=1903157 RepID=UPI002C39A8D4|nr:type II secretion system protein GspL [Albitalea sp.]HUG24857.1 type II secretion system protein GspL [Albitalea sp.]
MSVLVIQLAPRPRLRARDPLAAEPETARTTAEYVYALTPDGLALEAQGQCAASLLPKADSVVAVLADTAVSWHRITLPKAPAARMRAALTGVLEEAVLEEAELTHFAVAPDAKPGAPTWVAAMDRAWLRAELAALERAHVSVDRVVPAAWPDDPPSGHFAETDTREDGGAHGITLTWSHPDGVACLRLHGGLPRAVIPLPAPHGTRWSATPGAAASAEQWLGTTVNVMQPAQRLLQAARTLWNLRQFDLAQRNRGTRALRDVVRQFRRPPWRPVRFGLAALVVAQIIGLNLWAWHQRAAIDTRRDEVQQLVKATFPRLSDNEIRMAPMLVMQREVNALRLRAGKPAETDFEPMLQAAAMAWPDGQPPVDSLRYENGKLTLATSGWGDPQVDHFRSRLRPAGWQAEMGGDGRVAISRITTTGGLR